jgi:hypothetical protein
MKTNLCKQSLEMEIRLSVSDPPPEAKNVPLGQKKKRGRPKLSKPALLRQGLLISMTLAKLPFFNSFVILQILIWC